MKKWMNTMFFGSFFIAAILLEAYSIQILNGELFSTIALGVVVLISGYMFMDSIRSSVKKSSEDAKFYMDHILSDDLDKWNERYTELINLQKASYTAIKKNNAMIAEQFEEVLTRLEAMVNNNAKALQKITELQKKSLEGQKNALNLEIGYNKDNTKRIIGLLKQIQQSNVKDHEKTSEADWSHKDKPDSEADKQPIEFESIKVTPLYEDMNKSLTADEIAALFASAGK